jgi:hypothetical protein
MPRTKAPPEELKQRKADRNSRYYQSHKENWTYTHMTPQEKAMKRIQKYLTILSLDPIAPKIEPEVLPGKEA